MSKRKRNAHKNDFGHVLVAAGSPTMLGAACLTSLAAMRSGAGLVTAAVTKGLNLTLQKKISHVVMTRPVSQTRRMTFAFSAADELLKVISKYNAVAIGPGIGLDPSTVKFVHKMVRECPCPMVVDADALNALAGHMDVLLKVKGPRILTPHSGEMARLTGASDKLSVGADLVSARKKVAIKYSRQWKCIVVLKGHRTVVASPEGDVYVNTTGNPGMATAGCGDVLTGMIAALLAQGMKPFEAAKRGVRLHGEAGDRAAKNSGEGRIIATDLLQEYL